MNPRDAPVPLTFYQRSGLRFATNDPLNATPGRGLYRSSDGQCWAVIGPSVYRVTGPQPWAMAKIGTITANRTNLVSMTDNGISVMLVDGSANGFTWTLAHQGADFSQIIDSTGTFTGSIKVDYIDTFIVWAFLNSMDFGSTLSNEIVFNSLNFAGKTNYPDLLQTLIVNRHEMILFGALKSEIWYDAGNALFPFAELPGAYIEHGCLAPYSVASEDIDVYWLSQNLQGQGMVMRQRGYQTTRVSNHALEFALRMAFESGLALSDAIGFTYQQDGHIFYELTFPTADFTWVFDASVPDPHAAWHQKSWIDAGGAPHRSRLTAAANFFGWNIGQDWQNGSLYVIDPSYFYDDFPSAAASTPILYTRGFPHLSQASAPNGQLMSTEGRRLIIKSFIADIETGTTTDPNTGLDVKISVRWSSDRGRTFGNPIELSLGSTGQYLTSPKLANIGYARDPIFELFWTCPGPSALNGAWVDVEVMES